MPAVRARGKEDEVKHLFTDDVDTYVAQSLEQLESLIMAHSGDTYEEMTGEKIEDVFEQINDEKEVRIYWNSSELKGLDFISKRPRTKDDPFPDCDCLVIAKAKSWAEWHEPGFLCSTEY